jgi:hypothetical protein
MSLYDRLRATHPAVDIALKALTRNRLQTGLTMLGIMVGVATVLAMMAVGTGAQRSIEQQVRAAGLNQITIKAGNWKPKSEDSGQAIEIQGDAGGTFTLPVPDLTPREPAAADEVAIAASGRRPLHADLALWPGSASATSRPAWARRRPCRSPTRRPSASSTACSTSPAACTPTPASTSATSAGSPACTAPTCSCSTSSAPGR